MRMTPFLAQIAALFLAVEATASEPRMMVDVNIVTALDTSDSIGRHEAWIARNGLARAVLHPWFLDAARAGANGRVGFSVVTWSSGGRSEILIPWTVISTPQDAARISRRLLSVQLIDERRFSGGDGDKDDDHAAVDERLTDTAEAIRLAADHLRSVPFPSPRKVMNVVGNGASNTGRRPAHARAEALEQGFIINGLVLGRARSSIVEHYRDEIVGGPGSFVIELRDPGTMIEAFAAKLRMDIASAPYVLGRLETD